MQHGNGTQRILGWTCSMNMNLDKQQILVHAACPCS
jgi:hypothetical protein